MISGAGTELRLVGLFLRHGGWPRAALIAVCTALVSGLLLVALTVVLFSFHSRDQREALSGLVTDGGVRGGYVFALVLICLAPLTLLRQVVRLGTATREQRLAALRLVGFTPGGVRRVGALEVGVPAIVGAFLGYLVFWFLRALFGGSVGDVRSEVERQLHLVPVSVAPAWWQVVLIALAVGVIGVAAGANVTRGVSVSPLGVSRRTPRSAPRPWGGLPLVLAIPLFVVSHREGGGDAYAFAFVAALVVGLVGLAPWVAYRVGRTVAARSSSVPVLVAARRLTADARPAGRAAAAVGAIALMAGGGGALLADLPATAGDRGFSGVEPFYTVPVAMGGVVLLAALVLTIFAMAVHGVESLLDRKRSTASLAALGASMDELEQVQRWEMTLVALPMATLGVLIGSVPYLLLAGRPLRYAWIPVLVDVLTIALVWAAIRTSSRVTRPWLVRAAAPTHLRTT